MKHDRSDQISEIMANAETPDVPSIICTLCDASRKGELDAAGLARTIRAMLHDHMSSSRVSRVSQTRDPISPRDVSTLIEFIDVTYSIPDDVPGVKSIYIRELRCLLDPILCGGGSEGGVVVVDRERNRDLHYHLLNIIDMLMLRATLRDDADTLDILLEWIKDFRCRSLPTDDMRRPMIDIHAPLESYLAFDALRKGNTRAADVLYCRGARPERSPLMFTELFFVNLPEASREWCTKHDWSMQLND